jgi:hypothetical protein
MGEIEPLTHINSRIRLVRLRPEFAGFYPGWTRWSGKPLPSSLPGFWRNTRCSRVQAIWSVTAFCLREHFEFQGGNPRGTSGMRVRSRVTDPA